MANVTVGDVVYYHPERVGGVVTTRPAMVMGVHASGAVDIIVFWLASDRQKEQEFEHVVEAAAPKEFHWTRKPV